ncbi:transposase family protein [Kovacikia minuta CCNUW1]|uniref:helix-turn-helix domain-containing protein n=1 Tax=Kovacikia minuta TaxID=2931930 RepID=UPI001CCDC8AE|nr:transposase family protein [Kovacikia minuta]UBF29518.1 transposase family protein [Kovacikia minuta CCNUW1]
MTGLNRKAFENLLPSFNEAYQQSRSNPEVVRKRAPGGGRKATLRTSRDKLFYILLYCKCYPTFDLMSVLFDFDRSCAWDWVHGLLPVLEQALGHKQVLPERKVRSMEEFLERFPEVKEVIFHGTERPVQRPKDPTNKKSITLAKRNAIPVSTSQAVREKSELSS